MALQARYSHHRKEKYNKVNTFNDFMCMHRYSFGHGQAVDYARVGGCIAILVFLFLHAMDFLVKISND